MKIIFLILFFFSGNYYAADSAVSDFNEGFKYYDNKEYQKAFASYSKAAEQGDAKAQFNLGAMML